MPARAPQAIDPDQSKLSVTGIIQFSSHHEAVPWLASRPEKAWEDHHRQAERAASSPASFITEANHEAELVMPGICTKVTRDTPQRRTSFDKDDARVGFYS